MFAGLWLGSDKDQGGVPHEVSIWFLAMIGRRYGHGVNILP